MPPIKNNTDATLSHTEIRSVIIGLMLAILLGALDQTIVSVSLPMMSADLQGVDLLAWVVSGYLIAVAVATPIYGKLGDLYGRRLMLSTAIAIFLLASIACALADSMPMLVGARILQGLGGGGLISVAQAIIADVVAPRERGRYQGYVSGAFAIANVTGPLAGGLLTQYLSWRWIFWINVPLGLLALFISRRALKRLSTPHIKRPIDYLGAGLLSAGLTALLITITRIGQGGSLLTNENLALFSLSLALLTAFLWQEQRAVEPIIPLSLFRNSLVTISCTIVFIAFFQIISIAVLIPLRIQMLTDTGAAGAAFQLVPLSGAIPIGALISGKLTTYTGRYKNIQLVGTVLVPIAVLSLAFIDPGSAVLNALCMSLAGFGIGLQLPTTMVAVQNAVEHKYMGITTALTVFCRSLGAAVGIALLMAILLATLQAQAPESLSALSSGDLIEAMIDNTLAKTDMAIHLKLNLTAENAFQKIFTISAMVAAISFVLTMLIADITLSSRQPSAK